MSTGWIELEIEDPVAIVRIDRAERLGAFTFAMVDEIRAAIVAAAADERVVGIVITGTGRGFSAGLDAADLEHSTGAGAGDARWVDRSDPEELPALFSPLLRVPKPIVAAVNGVAAGGGLVLAMMCDLRFAAEAASFTASFSKRGLVAEHGSAWLLPRIVGPSRALDLLWSSRRIDAAEAHRIGLVDRVVPGDRLLDEARAYVADLAANVSPRSLATMKAQVYEALSLSLREACADADRRMWAALDAADAKEGVSSLLERRTPRFARWKGDSP